MSKPASTYSLSSFFREPFISDVLGSSLDVSDTETDIEINLAILKFKHKIHRKKI